MTKAKNKKSKVNKIEKPIKNYFILGIIIIITVVGALYLCSWYKQYNDNKSNTPVITSALREVKYNNLNTVLKERDMLIVYMCTTNESVCRNFEKKFADYVKDNNLTEEIVYLNLGYDGDENNTLNKIYKRYKSVDLVKKVYGYPTLLIFNEEKIVDVLSFNKGKINIDLVDEFLEGYEL